MHIDFAGPAGQLEGLLDGPRATGGKLPSVRAAVVFAHPLPTQGGTMHTKAVFQGAKGLCASAARCCDSIFVASAGASGFSTRARRDRGFPRGTRFGGRPLPGVPFGRPASHSVRGSRSKPAPRTPRVGAHRHRAAGHARDYTFAKTLETTKPKFFIQGDLDELCPIKDLMAFYAKLKEPKELAVIRRREHLFDGQTVKSVKPSKTCSRTTSDRRSV